MFRTALRGSLLLLLIVELVGCGSTYRSSGIIYVRQKNWEKAVEQLQLAVQQNPNDYDSQYNLGIALAELGRVGEAAEHFAKAREVNPRKAPDVALQQEHYWAIQYNAGVTQMNAGDFAGAVTSFQKATEAWPEDPRAYHLQGISYPNLGTTVEEKQANLNKGVESLRKATKLVSADSTAVVTWLDLAEMLRGADRIPEAIEAYQQSLTRHPSEDIAFRIHSQIADAYFKTKNWGEALTAYGKARELRPDDAQTVFLMGLTHYNAEEYPEAVPLFQEAAELSEGDNEEIYLDAIYYKGLAALNADDFKQAIEAADALISLRGQAFEDLQKEQPRNEAKIKKMAQLMKSYYLVRGQAKRESALLLLDQAKAKKGAEAARLAAEATRLTDESLKDFEKATSLPGGS